ncbi:MAG: hypothetical protein E6767_13765 [Dysgonomonas sp.]|nr:hypothetical protein [Dysgonomonas sp.]
MLIPTKIAICLVRVSSDAQDLDEQSRDLFNYAIRDGWDVNNN